MKTKEKIKPILLENIRNRERWVCDDITNIKTVSDVDYLFVHRTDNNKLFLMRKDALKIINS